MRFSHFWLRSIILATLITGILFWAEISLPMGALLLFLLALSIGLTWFIITLLKGNKMDLFDE